MKVIFLFHSIKCYISHNFIFMFYITFYVLSKIFQKTKISKKRKKKIHLQIQTKRKNIIIEQYINYKNK